MSNQGRFNWDKSFVVDFDLQSGLSETAAPTKRRLSQMKNMYCDEKAFEQCLSGGDPLVYEFYELGAPEDQIGDLAFGTSITYPGKVGDEYFMTKGHFHTILETAEVYFLLSGEGYLLLESPEGDVRSEKMTPGKAMPIVPSTPVACRWSPSSSSGPMPGTIMARLRLRASASCWWNAMAARSWWTTPTGCRR